MKKRLLQGFISKRGQEFKTGELLEISFDVKRDNGTITYQYFRATADDGRMFLSSWPAIPRYFGIVIPSQKALEKWTMDGISRSVGGKKIEPDGIDTDGMPSWLLVMGLI